MKNLFSQIIKAALIVGTLDILSACVHYMIKTGNNPVVVLRFVASGFFGKEAFSGGTEMIWAGLIFHYLIALCFTIFFFLIFPKVSFMTKNKILTGVLFGIFVWSVMNLIVVPLSNIGQRPFDLGNALINVAILIVGIGIPLSVIANNYYKKIT